MGNYYRVLVRCRRCGQPLGVAVWRSCTPLDVAKSIGFRCPKCLNPLPTNLDELQKREILVIESKRKGRGGRRLGKLVIYVGRYS